MATINSFPNNADEYIGAHEVMRWHHGRTSGVFGADGNAAVTAVQNEMKVSVSAGIGWLTDANGDGIVWWFDSAQTLTIDPAESSGLLNRIDRVIVRWYVGDYADKPEIMILKGTDGSTASPPAINTDARYRDISLAQVSIPAGTTAITPQLITDERQNPAVCGIVTETVTVDTSEINNQFQAFLAAIEEELQEIEAGTAFEFKKLQFNNVNVATSAFVADQTYTDYGYRASVALTGVIATMIPEVIFGLAEATSGSFAPIAETYNGGVYIYADSVPSAAITIPTIICWKGNAT